MPRPFKSYPSSPNGVSSLPEVDADHHVPLRVSVYAQGGTKPVLELAATDIAYGPVPASDVNVTPPTGTKTVDLSTPGQQKQTGDRTDVTGLAAVQAAVDFRVVAPDTRGYNLSSKPKGVAAYDTGLLAADIRGLIHERGAETAMLVGHDWGGTIAWATAMNHP